MSTDRRPDRPAAFDEGALEALFAEARAEAPPPLPDALRARLAEAALEARPVPVTEGCVASGWWARLRAALADFGGAPSLASLGAAGVAGIWIGFAGPGPTADLMSSVWPASNADWSASVEWAVETELGFAGIEFLTLLDSDTE